MCWFFLSEPPGWTIARSCRVRIDDVEMVLFDIDTDVSATCTNIQLACPSADHCEVEYILASIIQAQSTRELVTRAARQTKYTL